MREDAAAYTVVKIQDFPDNVRTAILADAENGGVKYGIIVVEEFVNGPSKRPVYGFYHGPPADLWAAAASRFGVAVPADDPAAEDAVRSEAEREASEEAAKVRAAEDAEVRAITKEEPPEEEEKPQNKNKNK